MPSANPKRWPIQLVFTFQIWSTGKSTTNGLTLDIMTGLVQIPGLLLISDTYFAMLTFLPMDFNAVTFL